MHMITHQRKMTIFAYLIFIIGLISDSVAFTKPLFNVNLVIHKHYASYRLNSVAAYDKIDPREITIDNDMKAEKLKYQILQLGASLDRGQAYNPTSGEYYKDRMDLTKNKITELIKLESALPENVQDIDGEWELVFSSVPNGIFRSSPFFLAIQEAYALVGEPEKAQLFFKLHELQTCSWGVSKIGRVAQYVNSSESMLYSEFDTSIFSLTVIPFLGWFKLLPTFGGRVITAAKIISLSSTGKMDMEVEYTTAKPIQGLQGLGDSIWGIKVPVGSIWNLLPWNNGRKATCSVEHVYLDSDFRIVKDCDGEYFVYSRPVIDYPNE